jgi:hypothetical protein
MNVLLLAQKDYANVGFNIAESLKKVNIPAICMTNTFDSRHNVTERAVVIENNMHLSKAIVNATVIIWLHSRRIPTPGVDLKGKLQVVFHGGTSYRIAYDKINGYFNKVVACSLVQTELGLGAKNEYWFIPPVNTEFIRPGTYDINTKFVIGHFPSNKVKKSTGKINKAIHMLKNDSLTKDKFEFRTGGFGNWRVNLDRIGKCDAYIDSLRYGLWGMSTLEAAALGKIVIGGFKLYPQYLIEYGKSPFLSVPENGVTELFEVLKKLILQDRGKTMLLQKAHRKWVEDLHSYTITGNKLKEILSAYA